MLILERKSQQEILIGNDIRIIVVRIKGERVQIGIAAPRHINVVRSELLPKLQPQPPCKRCADTGIINHGWGKTGPCDCTLGRNP